MPVRFCAECSNMLYPLEDKVLKRRTGQKTLMYACRSCHNKEPVLDLSEPIFRHVVDTNTSAKQKTYLSYDVTSDPRLPRTFDEPCSNCGNLEGVYFQRPVGKGDKLVLQFECVKCHQQWLSSKSDDEEHDPDDLEEDEYMNLDLPTSAGLPGQG